MPSLIFFATYLATFWTCNDCTKQADVTRCNVSCNSSSRNVCKRKSLQVAKIRLHVAILGCKPEVVSKQSMQFLQESLLCAIVASLKKLHDKLQRRHVTRWKLVSQCHFNTSCKTLYRIVPAVELDSTFCKDCRDFLKPLQVAARD